MSPSPANEFDDRPLASQDPNPPTYAAFSPTSGISTASKQRSTILVHRKSPLLVATPPAVTRALAFSHPFILPLSQVVGLITWSTGDPWESFLVVAGFWAVVLYGDEAMKWAGPLVLVVLIILGMYSRRYSPLSSSGWTPAEKRLDEKKKQQHESNAKHQKSLDEILDVMNTFTSRCNILMEPFMQLTDFLSTQRTATSATTRPALTSLFIRILFITPVWIFLTAPPLYILTTRRVVLALGTVTLSWHSRPARVTRTILWRSQFVRRIVSYVTGLSFIKPANGQGSSSPRQRTQQDLANSLSSSEPSGVRFTFVIFENQRRWLGIGWTTTLLAYERAAWTDEHLNTSDSKDNFKLPEVEHGSALWRWVKGSEWQVEGAGKSKTNAGGDGWIYYDNKWMDGRRGQDGWGRYTRRRKWYRDAELVEVSADAEKQQQHLDSSTDTLKTTVTQKPTPAKPMSPTASPSSMNKDSDNASIASTSHPRKRGSWFRTSRTSTPSGGGSGGGSSDFSGSERSTLRGTEEEDVPDLPPGSKEQQARDWEINDDVKMRLS